MLLIFKDFRVSSGHTALLQIDFKYVGHNKVLMFVWELCFSIHFDFNIIVGYRLLAKAVQGIAMFVCYNFFIHTNNVYHVRRTDTT